jgi:histone-lysine N-methyltransferase SETMAR
MLTPSVVLLHDNAHLHTSASTRALLEQLELIDHPPYSPDIALSDYHLITYLKKWLRTQCFNNNELMEGLNEWLCSQAEDFFDTGIQKLIPQ